MMNKEKSMRTPICDFVRSYIERDPLRMHMPGHKGVFLLGMEDADITEITGADSLYEASGIIRESEENARELFGSLATFYSTEGSSQCIRAMLYLALLAARRDGREPLILAARNVHKTFVTAVGLLDIEVEWIRSSPDTSYLACRVDTDALEEQILATKPTAVYVTSPDYLGNTLDLAAIAAVCHRHSVLLLVDNAHGAYLKFLPQSQHPLDLGADLICDSAHKTLPALTGAAYLHLGQSAPKWMRDVAKDALALFGSTSPSYLILQSLDAVNAYLADGYRQRLAAFAKEVATLKAECLHRGYTLVGDEPMKLTFAPKSYGYTGQAFASELERRGVICEFSDPDFTVLMLSCEQGRDGLSRLSEALWEIEPKESIMTKPPVYTPMQRVTSVREALFSARETILTEKAEGRVLAALNVACPPAVPIAVCGERLDADAIARMQYYGITRCDVMK